MLLPWNEVDLLRVQLALWAPLALWTPHIDHMLQLFGAGRTQVESAKMHCPKLFHGVGEGLAVRRSVRLMRSVCV